jgi:hypothetical protein
MIKKPKVGRPKIIKSRKKTAKIFVNITEDQKKKLVKKAEDDNLSLSQVCLHALKAQGII